MGLRIIFVALVCACAAENAGPDQADKGSLADYTAGIEVHHDGHEMLDPRGGSASRLASVVASQTDGPQTLKLEGTDTYIPLYTNRRVRVVIHDDDYSASLALVVQEPGRFPGDWTPLFTSELCNVNEAEGCALSEITIEPNGAMEAKGVALDGTGQEIALDAMSESLVHSTFVRALVVPVSVINEIHEDWYDYLIGDDTGAEYEATVTATLETPSSGSESAQSAPPERRDASVVDPHL